MVSSIITQKKSYIYIKLFHFSYVTYRITHSLSLFEAVNRVICYIARLSLNKMSTVIG